MDNERKPLLSQEEGGETASDAGYRPTAPIGMPRARFAPSRMHDSFHGFDDASGSNQSPALNLDLNMSPTSAHREGTQPSRMRSIPNSPTLFFARSYRPVFSTSGTTWNTRHDGTFTISPEMAHEQIGWDNLPVTSPFDDRKSLFSVIMDDGSRQRRRISLTSERSPRYDLILAKFTTAQRSVHHDPYETDNF
jgi:hypothetical protein